MKNNLYLLLISLYVFFLPGYLISKTGLKKGSPLSMLAASLSLSISLVPIAAFGIALLLHTTVQKSLVLVTATLINMVCIIIMAAKRKKKN